MGKHGEAAVSVVKGVLMLLPSFTYLPPATKSSAGQDPLLQEYTETD